MLNQRWWIVPFISLCFILAGCSQEVTPTTVPSDSPQSAFETPVSNQVETHSETVHADAAHEEGEHAEDQTDHAHEAASQEITPSVMAEQSAPSDVPAPPAAELSVALVPSELVFGENRFAVGLFDGEGQVVQDADVRFRYFDLSNANAPVLESEAAATLLQTDDGLTTIFAHERNFERAGDWGAEIVAQFPDGQSATARIAFQVLADSPSISAGETVPVTDTLTAAEVGNELGKLSSALTPNPAFYEVNLQEALTNGKPTVLLFATPAFCQTRFCGPAYEITSELQKEYDEQFNFIHVEVYTGLPDPAASNWQLAPAMSAFGLTTEPWLYLLDADGKVVYRVEGLFTKDEVAQQLTRSLGTVK